MKSQNRFTLCAATIFSETVELVTTFYVTDSKQTKNSKDEETDIVEDPLSYLNELEIDYSDILTLIKKKGYRLANWHEIELLKNFLILDPVARDRILIYQDTEDELLGIHPYIPFKEFFSFEEKSFLKRLFEDFYPIDNEDKVVLVCVKL